MINYYIFLSSLITAAFIFGYILGSDRRDIIYVGEAAE